MKNYFIFGGFGLLIMYNIQKKSSESETMRAGPLFRFFGGYRELLLMCDLGISHLNGHSVVRPSVRFAISS